MKLINLSRILAIATLLIVQAAWAEESVMRSLDNGQWQVVVGEKAGQLVAQFPEKPEVTTQDPNFDQFTGYELLVQKDPTDPISATGGEYRLLISSDVDILEPALKTGPEAAVQRLLPREMRNEQISLRVEEQISKNKENYYIWQGRVIKEYAQDGEWKWLDTVQLRVILTDELLVIATFESDDPSNEEDGTSFLESVQYQVR